MSIYVDGYDTQNPRATVTVHEGARSVRVTYQSKDGGKPFRVNVQQKPNPIGFHVALPGDRKR